MFTDFYGHIVFSVFESSDLKPIENFLAGQKENKYALYRKELDIENDIIPQRGGAHFPKAVFFKSIQNGHIIQFSNYLDGWVTLSNYISNNLHIPFYQFSFSNSKQLYKKHSFLKYEKGNIVRVVYAMQDPQWIFYEKGNILDFENTGNYQKKRIPDRLNKEIIIDYCRQLGMNINEELFWKGVGSSLFYERLQW